MTRAEPKFLRHSFSLSSPLPCFLPSCGFLPPAAKQKFINFCLFLFFFLKKKLKKLKSYKIALTRLCVWRAPPGAVVPSLPSPPLPSPPSPPPTLQAPQNILPVAPPAPLWAAGGAGGWRGAGGGVVGGLHCLIIVLVRYVFIFGCGSVVICGLRVCRLFPS
ncbi:hypothetical protein BDZ91DRAFT_535790 [Kalaharituber pfeilii]|nr:hypothetical protein BDZ91DRAFT_535790 [Kalaharituber pfeilii]